MRWLLVSSRSHPDEGGIGAYVRRFISAATAAGWTVHLVTRPGRAAPPGAIMHAVHTPDTGAPFQEMIEPLRRIERIRPYRYGLWSLAVAKTLACWRRRVDAIELIDSGAEGFVALTSRRVRARWEGVPLLLSCRTPMWLVEDECGLDPARFGRPLYHDWERRAAAAADGCLAPSRRLAVRIPTSAPVEVTADLLPGPCPPGGPAGGGERLLLVGDVHPNKGVEVWAQSLNTVLRERPDAIAVLVGPDTMTAPDGTSMTEHVRQLVDPSLRARLVCSGPQPHAQVQRLVRFASVVVVPSRFESFSNVAAEATVAGRPVIVTDGVGVLEHAPSLDSVPVGDVRALADAQLRTLADPAAARRRAESALAELRVACDPARHLAARVRLASRAASARAPLPGPDESIHAMRDFLAGVERSVRPIATGVGGSPVAAASG